MSKIKESNRTIGRLENGIKEITKLLEDALNVKLRYQEIIKRAIQNESGQTEGKKLSFRQIVKSTPIDPRISLEITPKLAEHFVSYNQKKTPMTCKKSSISQCEEVVCL